jgi:hypothetical protein
MTVSVAGISDSCSQSYPQGSQNVQKMVIGLLCALLAVVTVLIGEATLVTSRTSVCKPTATTAGTTIIDGHTDLSVQA